MAETAASPCGLLAMTLGRIPPLKKPSLETPAWDITGEYKVKCKAKPGILRAQPADLVLTCGLSAVIPGAAQRRARNP